VGSIGGSHPSSIIREFCSILASVDQEEYRSSGVQEFRIILNLERIEDRSDLTGEQAFQAPTEPSSVATFQAGSESLSERHSELLNSSILNSFQIALAPHHWFLIPSD
jgi:hypothetical protein